MSDTVTVAMISGLALILSGVLVELVRTRRRAGTAAEHAEATAHEMEPNSGSSLRDAIDRIERRQMLADERGARTEGKVDRLARKLADHLDQAATESRTIARIMRHLDLPDSGE